MKLLITDLHHGNSTSEYDIKYQLDHLEWLKEIIKEYNCDGVINCGDTHDKRMIASFRIIELFKQKHREISEMVENMYIIAGNHDNYYTNSNQITSLPSFFQSPNQILIQDEGFVDPSGKLFFIPWINESNSERLSEFVRGNNRKGNFLFSHLEQGGFRHGGTFSKNNQLYISDFSKYDKVFSGHFHEKQEQGNLIYLGNGYQKDFGELERKFVHVLNEKTGEIIPIENRNWIYKKILIENEDSEETIKEKCFDIENKKVRIYIDSSDTNFIIECEKIINSFKPYTRTITSKNPDIEYEEEMSTENINKTDEEMNLEFLDKICYNNKEQKECVFDNFEYYWKRSAI